MIYFQKSQPAPECLALEKAKASGDYKCSGVLERLRDDFQNKCYICEKAEPESINVEHFRPHRGNVDLKFSWDNLFWSCAHCNNLKGDRFSDVLDCTNIDDQVELRLKYEFKPFPFENVKIHALDQDPVVLSTQSLIECAFNGSTELKVIESANLRNALLHDIKDFQDNLIEYFHRTCSGERKDFVKNKIRAHLHPASNFTAFKRWIIRDSERFMAEFQDFMVVAE